MLYDLYQLANNQLWVLSIVIDSSLKHIIVYVRAQEYYEDVSELPFNIFI